MKDVRDEAERLAEKEKKWRLKKILKSQSIQDRIADLSTKMNILCRDLTVRLHLKSLPLTILMSLKTISSMGTRQEIKAIGPELAQLSVEVTTMRSRMDTGFNNLTSAVGDMPGRMDTRLSQLLNTLDSTEQEKSELAKMTFTKVQSLPDELEMRVNSRLEEFKSLFSAPVQNMLPDEEDVCMTVMPSVSHIPTVSSI